MTESASENRSVRGQGGVRNSPAEGPLARRQGSDQRDETLDGQPSPGDALAEASSQTGTEEPAPVLLDTNVVIDLGGALDPAQLPDVPLYLSAITLAELSAGVVAASSDDERAARTRRLQWVESSFYPIPFDAAAARFYGHVFARVRSRGRQPRRRLAELQTASIAGALGWSLLTRDADDFAGLEGLVAITSP